MPAMYQAVHRGGSGAPRRPAGMHEAAESGEAAHAAYKGGLAAGQAQRLAAWTQALQPAPGAGAALAAEPDGGALGPAADGDGGAVELFRRVAFPEYNGEALDC
jgi:hypothetical protein